MTRTSRPVGTVILRGSPACAATAAVAISAAT